MLDSQFVLSSILLLKNSPILAPIDWRSRSAEAEHE